MALRPLKVLITGDTTQLEKALSRAGAGLRNFATVAGAATAAAVGGLGVLASQGVALANELQVLSQRANTTPESLQRLAAGARTVGIDMQGMSDILQDVNDRVGDFLITGGGPMADFFEKIAPRVGVTAEQFRGLSGPQALQLYVDTLQKAGVNQQQMTFFMEGMSSEATRLIPLLRDGGAAMQGFGDAAEQAGNVVQNEMIDRIGRASTALRSITGIFDTLRLRLAAEMAPALEVIAARFQQIAQSDAVQRAVTRIVDAFSDLAMILLSDDFLNVAVQGLEALLGVAGGVAEGMVAVSQNIEAVTIAMGSLAIAAAALGGPLTLVVGALAAALGGIAIWRSSAEDAAIGSDAAADAQGRLNEALGVFYSTGAPSAGKAAIALANDNYKLAQSAVAAAEAEVAKQQAMVDSMAAIEAQRPVVGADDLEGQFLLGAATAESEKLLAARARLEESRAGLMESKLAMDRAARSVTGADFSAVTLPEIEAVNLPEIDWEGLLGDLPQLGDIPGLGGGKEMQDKLQERLEALQDGLMTEREVVDEWYQDGLTVLAEALDARKITEEEYRNSRERLEKEHQERLSQIRDEGNKSGLMGVIGAGKEVLSAIGANNKKAADAAKALGQFEALVNAYRAASQALADPTVPFWSKAAAAASVLASGIGFANSIKGMSGSGGGASGGVSAPSAAVPAATAAPVQSLEAVIRFEGSSEFSADPRAVSRQADLIMNELKDRGISAVRGFA